MRTIFPIIFFLVLFRSAVAQNDFVFSHLNEEDGLSNNIVNSFLKDSRGIMWIGTFNGFNRFDGSNFYTYNIRKGSNSMNSEVVQEMCEDKNGNLWGCTSNGVFKYNVKEDSFVNYFFPKVEYPRFFFNILADLQGRIWTTTFRDQLYLYNSKKDTFELAVKLGEHFDKPNDIFISKNGLLEDEQGLGLWMSTTQGMVYYDFKSGKIKNYKTNPGDELYQKINASGLSKGRDSNFWYFDNDNTRAVCFSTTSHKIINTINLKNNYDFSSVATTFVDNKNRLWISTWNYKAYVIDITTKDITPLIHNTEDARSIASGFFWGTYQDEDNTIWLGSTNGISRCNPEAGFYKEYRLADHIPELVNDHITKIEEDPVDKSFWIVTSGKLLIHVMDGKKYKIYNLLQSKPNAKGDLPDGTNQIHFQENSVIITTYTGAWMLKKGSKQLIPYTNLPKGYENFKCSEIIFEKHDIYFNDGRQVLHWHKKDNLTQIYKHESEASLPQNIAIISQIKLDNNNKLWAISDENHLAYLNDNKKFSRINMLPPDGKETGRIVGMEIDKEGKIWFPYHMKGLCKYDPVSKKIVTRNITDGLPTNRMQIMKLDQVGRPWIMNYNKMSVYLPDMDKFYNFKIPYSDHYLNYQNHFTRRSNGNFITSINNEIVEFFQDKLFAKPTHAKPLISQVSLLGREIPVLNDEKIVLGTKENTVRFRFGTTIDNKIFPYDIEYMLEGAEETWTMTSGTDEALYNNLAPGNYKFRIKAKGKNSVWETEEAILVFTIKTPFHRTPWFFAVVGLLCIGSLLFLYRYRLAQKEKLLLLENKAQMLEKEKVMVMYESLKQQLNPHFLFNSLTSLSGLIETNQQVAGDFLEQMSGIYRYILKNGDNETVSLKDEIDFVQLYINLQQTRFKKGLQVNISVPDEYLHYKIAPVTLQNLIENAIKHNIIDAGSPLIIDIFIEEDYLVVRNNLQRKNVVETSNKRGLAQFTSLYRYLSDWPVIIEETEHNFQIRIPLI